MSTVITSPAPSDEITVRIVRSDWVRTYEVDYELHEDSTFDGSIRVTALSELKAWNDAFAKLRTIYGAFSFEITSICEVEQITCKP
jgi:hypothetical protein